MNDELKEIQKKIRTQKEKEDTLKGKMSDLKKTEQEKIDDYFSEFHKKIDDLGLRDMLNDRGYAGHKNEEIVLKKNFAFKGYAGNEVGNLCIYKAFKKMNIGVDFISFRGDGEAYLHSICDLDENEYVNKEYKEALENAKRYIYEENLADKLEDMAVEFGKDKIERLEKSNDERAEQIRQKKENLDRREKMKPANELSTQEL